MDWFKNNPFLAGLVSLTALLAAASGYWLYSSLGRLTEQQEALESKRGEIESLQNSKPFPDQTNVKAAKEELKLTEETLNATRAAFSVTLPSISPQAFQDALRGKVNDIVKKAQANDVALEDGFYLGFEAFEKQPPSPAEAPALALQLDAIYSAVSQLVNAKVKSIGAVAREVSRPAGQPEAGEQPQRPKGKDQAGSSALDLRGFDLNFTAEQASFKNAFNGILASNPPIFVRLVAITNSSLAGPPKNGGEATMEPDVGLASNEDAGQIKPVLGRELLTVNLRLATAAPDEPAK
jgi:hypothetical protein